MDKDNRISRLAPVWLQRLFVSIALLLASAPALSDAIDSIEIDEDKTPAQIRVNFTFPMQYINHAPESHGDKILIQLRSIRPGPELLDALQSGPQAISVPPSHAIPLRDAGYEQESADLGILTIRFRRPIDFSVQAGADRRHLIIRATPAGPKPSSPLPASPPIAPAAEPGTQVTAPAQISPPVTPSAPAPEPVKPPPAVQPEAAPPETEQPVAAVALPKSSIVADDHRYVVNLESSTKPIVIPPLRSVVDAEQIVIYTSRFQLDGRNWNRLRVGFFASRSDAQVVLNTFKRKYPQAWIAVATDEEVADALAQIGTALPPAREPPAQIAAPRTESTLQLPDLSSARKPLEWVKPPVAARAVVPTPTDTAAQQADTETAAPGGAAVPAPAGESEATAEPAVPPATPTEQPPLAPEIPTPALAVPDIQPTRPEAPTDKIEALMEEARQAMARQDYNRAIQLYTKILEFPDHPYRQDALEFLAVARERKGQLAHAIREYQRYLSLYPEGEGADRVRQRLAGLTTATERPKSGPRRAKVKTRDNPWEVYGGFSQYYLRNENTLDDDSNIVTQSALSSDLDVTARKRSENYDIQSRFTGSYLRDFLDDGPGDESSVSSLYFDARDKRHDVAARLGRQSRNTGGVLGRFDGLLLGYQLTDWMTVNGVAGFPVVSTRDQVDTDKTLYGISADFGTFANAWDFNAFFIEQKVHDIVDRRAIGGEVRYFDSTRSLLSFVDYDISYDSLNTMIFLGTWTLPDKTTLNATVDYRNSPILTTTNALQGQTVRDLDDLLDSLSEDQIRALAEDRTAEYTTVSLGASHPFSERIQVSGDVTVTNLSDTEASGGVEAIPGTGNEYLYNLQLIGSNIIKSGDIAIGGLRYSNLDAADIYSVSLNTRYPVNSKWRINPRVRVDYRENNRDDSTQWIGVPSIRMDYRLSRRYRFELEGGGEWSSRKLPDLPNDEDTSSYFISAGYRIDF
jgi:tetratricopeptide (TPR) repeat protein